MTDYERIARKITIVLFSVQSFSSAGFIAVFTVNALVGMELTGQATLAGLPEAVRVLGHAAAAMGWGYAMERLGRRRSLALGQMVGVLGSAVAGSAVIVRSFPLFMAGLVLMGMARASADLGRFAAAEVHVPEQRGKAIAHVVLGGTVGSVLGPLLVGPTGRLALSAGLQELAGPYSIGLVFWALAGTIVFLGLKPEPRDVARELASQHPQMAAHRGRARPLMEIVRQPGVFVAMTGVVLAQMVMVMLMVMTSVHMKALAHPLTSVSLVISVHTLGMFALAVVSGRLTDRWGRGPMIILGSIILIAACLLAAPAASLLPLLIALFLLGLGWNFVYVAGSALLADQLSVTERAKTQGLNDLLLGLASAAGSFGSGLIFAAAGYGGLAVTAAAVAVAPLALTVWWHVSGRSSPITADRLAASHVRRNSMVDNE